MATIPLPHDESFVHGSDHHLEIFSLIWLDANDRFQENQDRHEKLRAVINHLKIFHDVAECINCIERRAEDDRLVLIIHGRWSGQVVPSVHQLRQVSSIYIYSENKESDEMWTCEFAKVTVLGEVPVFYVSLVQVKAVTLEIDELIRRIEQDYSNARKTEEPLLINMFNTATGGAGKSTTGITGEFVFSQLLIDCLLRLKCNEKDREELIACCKNEYRGNATELAKIREFREDYSADNALTWYTRDSFFYKILNAALRKRHIHIIFLYRSIIADLHRQLQQHKSQRHALVYRFQLMSRDELDNLQQHVGHLVSVNSFLSTSKKRIIAEFYMGDTTHVINSERVLFEIEAAPQLVKTKPFADISTLSHFSEESEVLFMLGSIFRLNSVSRDQQHVWVVAMTLCHDDDHDLKCVLKEMKKQNGTGDTNLWTLGKLLWNMGELTLAEEYYSRFVQELPPYDPSLHGLYADLSVIASQQRNFDKSVQWRQKSLEMRRLIGPTSSMRRENAHTFIQICRKDLQLHEEIGRGAFGAVHRATWLTRRHIVAVKKLHLTHFHGETRKQFFVELDFMDRVRSPHVVNFYAACIERETYILVMEYMSLGSLYKMLHDDDMVFVWPERFSIGLQSAKGINYLHQLEPPVLHRDLKSLNCLMERAHEGYTVKLCDFGLAQTCSETTRLTAVNHPLACTLHWTAPEVLRLERHTEKSDIYSLGVVYWELTTSQKPYELHKDSVIREFVVAGGRLKIPQTTPSTFCSIINKCWAHDPIDRPNSSDLIEMIEACIAMQSNTPLSTLT